MLQSWSWTHWELRLPWKLPQPMCVWRMMQCVFWDWLMVWGLQHLKYKPPTSVSTLSQQMAFRESLQGSHHGTFSGEKCKVWDRAVPGDPSMEEDEILGRSAPGERFSWLSQRNAIRTFDFLLLWHFLFVLLTRESDLHGYWVPLIIAPKVHCFPLQQQCRRMQIEMQGAFLLWPSSGGLHLTASSREDSLLINGRELRLTFIARFQSEVLRHGQGRCSGSPKCCFIMVPLRPKLGDSKVAQDKTWQRECCCPRMKSWHSQTQASVRSYQGGGCEGFGARHESRSSFAGTFPLSLHSLPQSEAANRDSVKCS